MTVLFWPLQYCCGHLLYQASPLDRFSLARVAPCQRGHPARAPPTGLPSTSWAAECARCWNYFRMASAASRTRLAASSISSLDCSTVTTTLMLQGSGGKSDVCFEPRAAQQCELFEKTTLRPAHVTLWADRRDLTLAEEETSLLCLDILLV